MFPIGSVIVIDNFHGKHGKPKRRWFIYFGKFEYAATVFCVICTTTARKKKYIDGNRKHVPHLIIPRGCFNVDSVVDIRGVYILTEKELGAYSPERVCCLNREVIEDCRRLLAEHGDIEDFVKEYLVNLRV